MIEEVRYECTRIYHQIISVIMFSTEAVGEVHGQGSDVIQVPEIQLQEGALDISVLMIYHR